MTLLNEFPIHEQSSTASGMLLPILHKLASMLNTLKTSGNGNILDLRDESLTQAEIAALNNLLGPGEINATFNNQGQTTIRETGIAGIRWITRINQQGDVSGELVEINHCPEMLKRNSEELNASFTKLQDKIARYSHRPMPD